MAMPSEGSTTIVSYGCGFILASKYFSSVTVFISVVSKIVRELRLAIYKISLVVATGILSLCDFLSYYHYIPCYTFTKDLFYQLILS